MVDVAVAFALMGRAGTEMGAEAETPVLRGTVAEVRVDGEEAEELEDGADEESEDGAAEEEEELVGGVLPPPELEPPMTTSMQLS